MGSSVQNQPVTADAELSPALRDKIKWFMDRMLQTFTKNMGESVRLICGHSITEAVLKEIPTAALMWNFNDFPLALDPSRILYYKGNVDITDLTPGDTGVYQCLVQWGTAKSKRNMTLGVYSVQVTTDTPTRYVFADEPMKFHCHSETLGKVFPDATRHWRYNGSAVKVPEPAPANARQEDVISHVTKSMAGVWECQVVQTKSERVWNTAWLKLGIQDSPSKLSKWYIVLVDHRITVVMVASIIVVVLIILFVLACFKMKTTEDEAEQDFIKQRGGWEEILTKYEQNGRINLDAWDDIKKYKRGDEDEENKDRRKDGVDKSKEEIIESGKGNDEEDTEAETKDHTRYGNESSSESDDDNNADTTTDDDDDDEDDEEESQDENDSSLGYRTKRSLFFSKDEEDEDGYENANRDNILHRSNMASRDKINRSFSSQKGGRREKLKNADACRTLRPRTTNRQRKSRTEVTVAKRKKRVRPHVTKKKLEEAHAYTWLLQNSAHLRQLDAQLQDKRLGYITEYDMKSASFKPQGHNQSRVTETSGLFPKGSKPAFTRPSSSNNELMTKTYQSDLGWVDNYYVNASDVFPDTCPNKYKTACDTNPFQLEMSCSCTSATNTSPPVEIMQPNHLLIPTQNQMKNFLKVSSVIRRNRARGDTANHTPERSRFGRSFQSLNSWFAQKLVGLFSARSSDILGSQQREVRYSVLPQSDIAEDEEV